jgi:hypothetical protein
MGSPEEAGQPPWSPSAASDAPADPRPDPAAPPVPGGHVLTDDDVAEIERQVTEEDLPPQFGVEVLTQIRRRHEEDRQRRAEGEDDRALRRREDQAWLDAVRAQGFSGVLFDLYCDQLIRYAVAVMMSWTRTGKIVKKCREKGRPVRYSVDGPRLSDDERLSVVGLTVATALEFFLNEVLRPGKWNQDGGASLRTYFVGACLLQFPNIYNTAMKKQEQEESHRGGQTVEDAEETSARPGNVYGRDPVGDAAAAEDEARRILASITDPQTRALVDLVVLRGMKQKDAATRLGMLPGTASARLKRYLRNARPEGSW